MNLFMATVKNIFNLNLNYEDMDVDVNMYLYNTISN